MNPKERKVKIKEIKQEIHKMNSELKSLIDGCEHVVQSSGYEGMYAKCTICHTELGDYCESSSHKVCEYEYITGDYHCIHCGKLEDEK